MKRIFTIFVMLCCCSSSYAQRITAQQYIDMYKDLAIREMKRMGVPASITLAQGLLETEGGNSELLKKSNNHFGIKCKDTWSAAGVTHDDDAKGECFRVYKSAEESYRDHSNFLRSREWYAPLFKLDPTDYKGWAYGLKKAGYATNPHYPEMLIKFIEDNHLHQYDNVDKNEIAHFDASKYTDDKEVPADLPIETAAEVKPLSKQEVNKEITINNLKAVWVPGGTSLLAFANAHHLNLDKVLEYNDLAEDGLTEKDQYLFLERKLKEGAKDSYTTSTDEGLWEISQKNGLRLQKLLNYNNYKADQVVPTGTVLYLTAKNHSDKVVATGETKIHKVQPKEGLNAISKKYGISVEQIKEWNNLHTENLQIGQELIVSK